MLLFGQHLSIAKFLEETIARNVSVVGLGEVKVL